MGCGEKLVKGIISLFFFLAPQGKGDELTNSTQFCSWANVSPSMQSVSTRRVFVEPSAVPQTCCRSVDSDC